MLVFAKRVERIFRSEWNVLRRVISVGQSVIQPVTVVRDLGVLIDGELSMRQHVTRLAQTCFFHLRWLRSLRRQLGRDVSSETEHSVSPHHECGIDCQPTSDSCVRRRHSGAILRHFYLLLLTELR